MYEHLSWNRVDFSEPDGTKSEPGSVNELKPDSILYAVDIGYSDDFVGFEVPQSMTFHTFFIEFGLWSAQSIPGPLHSRHNT